MLLDADERKIVFTNNVLMHPRPRTNLKISFNQTHSDKVSNLNGYGYAAQMCKESLAFLGHDVSWRDHTADVEINFIQPEHWHWSGVDYRIGYVPWESTALPDGWVKAMNEVDEVWTPSPVIAEWYRDAGVTKEVKVYEHGVESIWSPRLRPPTGRFHVLHHGAEALRKGGNDIIRGFQNSLWEKDAELMLKMDLRNFGVIDSEHIKIFRKKLPIDELVSLYHDADLFCYPSYGEGFGLTPLQAMATGMPVLITEGWAPYQRLLPESSLIKSDLVDSPWPDVHPGRMFRPDPSDLEEKLLWHYENREEATKFALDLAETVRREYDWVALTRAAFEHLT